MNWLFALPLLATLGACAVLVRSLQLLAAESRALTASAERLVPVASAVGEATRRARTYGATVATGYGAAVASATRRYTPRHG